MHISYENESTTCGVKIWKKEKKKVISLNHSDVLNCYTGTTSWQCCWGNHLGTSTAELLWLRIFLTPHPIMQKLSPPFSLHHESTEWERRNPRLVHKQAAINSSENEFSLPLGGGTWDFLAVRNNKKCIKAQERNRQMTWHQAIIPPSILNPEIPFLFVPNVFFPSLYVELSQKLQFVLVKKTIRNRKLLRRKTTCNI